MDRRKFIATAANAGWGLVGLGLAGCGQQSPQDSGALVTAQRDASGTVKMYDIVLKGYSNFSGTLLGDAGVLHATQVRDNRDVTLPYEQDDDGHTFQLTTEHFAALKRGESVSVDTTVNNDHNHKVVVDPRNRLPGSQAIDIPVGDGGETVTVYALVTDDEEHPDLYVSGSAELDEASVQYCLDTTARCDADESLWHAMRRHAPRTDVQIFRSEQQLSLDKSATDQLLNLRGKAKSDSRALRFLLRLVNQKV
jgi:hypothetical protein